MTPLAANFPFFPEEGDPYVERDLPVLEKIQAGGVPTLFEVEVAYTQSFSLERAIDFPFADELQHIVTHYVLYLCKSEQHLSLFLIRNAIQARQIRQLSMDNLSRRVRLKVQQALKWRSPHHVTQICVLNSPARTGSEERRVHKMRA